MGISTAPEFSKLSPGLSTTTENSMNARILTVLLSAIMLAGCTAISNQNAIAVERKLAAAGFQTKLATTDDQLAHLQTLQQRTLFPTQKDGGVVYVYADAEGCKCLMVGAEENYQEYQRIVLQQRAANEQRMAAAEMEEASMNWDMWGGWPRPIVYVR